MAYVVAASWTAATGKEELVASYLSSLRDATRREEGCLMYLIHRSLENPRVFFIYEQYTSEAAFNSHVTSAHFLEYGRKLAIPHLEHRERSFYELLD
ncbi:MAG: putative quinol monooxygenase [Chloroflexota bacterium]